ncbi:MAG: hypothetical protein ABW168_10175, partial [Sedimenticola sp.]
MSIAEEQRDQMSSMRNMLKDTMSNIHRSHQPEEMKQMERDRSKNVTLANSLNQGKQCAANTLQTIPQDHTPQRPSQDGYSPISAHSIGHTVNQNTQSRNLFSGELQAINKWNERHDGAVASPYSAPQHATTRYSHSTSSVSQAGIPIPSLSLAPPSSMVPPSHTGYDHHGYAVSTVGVNHYTHPVAPSANRSMLEQPPTVPIYASQQMNRTNLNSSIAYPVPSPVAPSWSSTAAYTMPPPQVMAPHWQAPTYNAMPLRAMHESAIPVATPEATYMPFRSDTTPAGIYGSSDVMQSAQARHNYQGQHIKLPKYDGSEEIEVFLTPFERLALKYGWGPCEKVDKLYESLHGKAMSYMCALPKQISEDYDQLKNSLIKRFGRRDPPGTARRQLSEIRQRSETNEEFGEQIRRLVSAAYPGIELVLQ